MKLWNLVYITVRETMVHGPLEIISQRFYEDYEFWNSWIRLEYYPMF